MGARDGAIVGSALSTEPELEVRADDGGCDAEGGLLEAESVELLSKLEAASSAMPARAGEGEGLDAACGRLPVDNRGPGGCTAGLSKPFGLKEEAGRGGLAGGGGGGLASGPPSQQKLCVHRLSLLAPPSFSLL